MIAFICLFFPAIVSVYIFESLTKINLNLKQLLFRFCTNTLLINALCFIAKKILFKTAADPLYYFSTDMTPSTALNYILLAVIFAVAITIAEVLLSKKIKITIENEIEDDEQNEDEKQEQK